MQKRLHSCLIRARYAWSLSRLASCLERAGSLRVTRPESRYIMVWRAVWHSYSTYHIAGVPAGLSERSMCEVRSVNL